MADFERKSSCDKCGSIDNLAIFSDGSYYCYTPGCTNMKVSEEYKVNKKATMENNKDNQDIQQSTSKKILSKEEAKEIRDSTSAKCFGYRGLKDSTTSYFGVRHSFDDSGKVIRQYYPCTINSELVGYKVRFEPKDFRSKGETGQVCELFGQFRFPRGGKYVVITEGELCCLSAYQMFKDYSDKKGSNFVNAVVSATTGANSKRQIKQQYKFFDSFENIVICYDNDKAGQDAIEELVQILPKGKVKIMQLRYKDANEYLMQGKESEFITDFYNAKPYIPAGVVGSSELYQRLLDGIMVEKIPFPPFMKKLDEMVGSIELGTIGVFAAGSGSAKTTVANECLYYWLFNSPHKVAVVSLELNCTQYAQSLLSRHIGYKINSIKNLEDKMKFLTQEDVVKQAESLFKTEDGMDRFALIDERDGSIEVLQDKIEELVISVGAKVIVLDPVSDLQDSMSIDQQAMFMKWMKSIIKNYNVTFILIAHIRKAGNNKEAASTGAFSPEEAISGSSTVFKSASWVVMMQRDKYSEDNVVRNTTNLVLSKNRNNGITGQAGKLYYDNQTHTLHDYDTYFADFDVGTKQTT